MNRSEDLLHDCPAGRAPIVRLSTRRPQFMTSALGNVFWTVVGAGTGLLIVWPLGTLTAASPLVAATVATCCYLAAAALDTKWLGWAAVPLVTAMYTLGELVGSIPRWLPVAILVTGLLAIGLVRNRRPTLVQFGAMMGFLGAACSSVYLTPNAGLAVAGLCLASHAAWDLVHYRRDAVVPRSLAIWCVALDMTAGAACLLAAWRL